MRLLGSILRADNRAQIPVPGSSSEHYIYQVPAEGNFWLSSQSENRAEAAQILELMTTEEFYVGLAEGMARPPLDASALERADVHHTYRQAVDYFEEIVRFAPVPLVANSHVAEVLAEMKDVSPNLGQIVQGSFSGAIRDVQGALETYCGRWSAERERAIEVVRERGVDVSLDDWVFANWRPGEDFGPDKYP